jgi:hypothetical protein
MKSVGEVMSIGRTFEEAMQKALRMIDQGFKGFDAGAVAASDEDLKNPTDMRPFVIASALLSGYTVDRIHELTKIDHFFLHRLKSLTDLMVTMKNLNTHNVPQDVLLEAKRKGFSDAQIANYVDSNEVAIRNLRKSMGIRPYVKQIDTGERSSIFLASCTSDLTPSIGVRYF